MDLNIFENIIDILWFVYLYSSFADALSFIYICVQNVALAYRIG